MKYKIDEYPSWSRPRLRSTPRKH